LYLVVKDTPEECGYKNLFPARRITPVRDVHGKIGEVFKEIVTNPLVWIIAFTYACTGAVRQSIDQCFHVFSKRCITSI